VRLAADANVILAAVAGGAAGRVFRNPRVEIYTAQSVIEELEEYIPRIAALKGLDEALLRMTLAHIPLTVVEPDDYEAKREEAFRRIGHRDPDDVDLLALALARDLPVWSNDDDFEDTGVEWYTTAEILRRLETE
jgi:predicted nucleic acid-binding protein